MAKMMDSNTARDNWRAVLDAATAGGQHIVVTRYGKPAIAVIAYDDFVAIKSELAYASVKRKRRGARRPRVLAQEHPYFNSSRDDARTVDDVLNDLRGGRYRGV